MIAKRNASMSRTLREQSRIRIGLVPRVLRGHVTPVVRRRRRGRMVTGRVWVVMAVGRRVRVTTRVMLHLVRPCRGRWALVVLGRHVAARTRAAGRVGTAAAAHAAEVARRRASRYRASTT